tara:strand:+ start:945 stop:1865 length:921 start_codon:yes stop_codon:yes gene_type:complete
MKTNNKKIITSSAYLLFFALLLASHSGFSQDLKDLKYFKDFKEFEDFKDFKDFKDFTMSTASKTNDSTASKTNNWWPRDIYAKSVNIWPYYGIKFFNSEWFKISMGTNSNFKYGPVSSYSIKTTVAGVGAGFTWGSRGQTPIAALSNRGEMQISKSLAIGDRLIANTVLTVDGRTYISENGGDEKGFDNVNHDNYKDYLLWVEEGIVSKAFAISEVSEWPDYVFTKDYNLPSLEEVEENISKTGHLHTMLAGTEIEKNGFTVSNMIKRMVKTIEELTLHTIAQEKQIDALMDRLMHLEQILEDKGK